MMHPRPLFNPVNELEGFIVSTPPGSVTPHTMIDRASEGPMSREIARLGGDAQKAPFESMDIAAFRLRQLRHRGTTLAR